MADRRPLPIPSVIGLLFGSVWGALGSLSLAPAWRTPAVAISALVGLGLILRLFLSRADRPGGSGLFHRPAYMAALAGEVIAIYAASAVLPWFGLEDYFIPVLGLIVGLHFIGLWRAAGDPHFLWIAGAMCAVSASALVYPHPAWRNVTAGLGNALVLWIGAA